ncbi:hypothetical protein [Thalassobacillus sp. CUG 92003]|uniref:hypothetical protein n=1 Tax=Thalassobacillus sp. CUG 92003 TaxID=2736641 RepID=UPI0015E666C5|nr:hypothetical protein [Thalassobacillus sp. CUG 92003]
MADVHIELSSEQYRKLVEALYLGTWMVNSTRMELDEAFEEVRHLVLAKHQEAGLEDEIFHQEESNIYDLEIEYETELLDRYVEPYDEASFGDKLVEKLAEKELVREYGAPIETMTDEIMARRMQLEEQIREEISKNGLTNLELNL